LFRILNRGRNTRICTEFLEAENIPVLVWPAYSPDMSPIEHVWNALDRRIRKACSRSCQYPATLHSH
uniref:Tc1-like transposase DDE domain-containing protein n=1 Tax=Esox lucius TaxID=8010 RepID=A0A3P8YVF9_ESOLU